MSQKVYSLLAISLLCLLPSCLLAEEEECVAATTQQEPFQPFTGRVTGNKVRLRAQSHLDGHVVREINNTELFTVTGEESEFFAIQPPKESKGYIFRTFVLDNVVEGDRVNVRLLPDIESPIIGRLNSGDRIEGQISEASNKWLEIDLPANSQFYIAKEYVSNIGPVEMIAQMESKRAEGSHHLKAAFLYARSEMQKPFEEIDLEGVSRKFETLIQNYSEFADIVARAREANNLVQETYSQKKVAFAEIGSSEQTRKLAEMGRDLKQNHEMADIADSTTKAFGLSNVNDKMLVWQPLEESLFQLWAITHEEKSMDQFYEEEELNSTVLNGIIEIYNKPVKNKPGDYLLKDGNIPVAFLYSTMVNLNDKIGKEITVVATPRPNNNFAFPAYFVLSVE